jgi:putative ABC transport system permease protein
VSRWSPPRAGGDARWFNGFALSREALQIVAAAGFTALAVATAAALRLDLARQIGWAAGRAAAQLAAVGALITLVFNVPALAAVFVAAMVLTAALTSGGRLRVVQHARRRVAVAIGVPALVAVGLLLAIGAFAATPRAAVPTAGILIGGAMTAATLTGRRLLEALDDQAEEIETRLSLGDDAATALRPVLRRAVTTGLVPAIDQTRTVGLVTLPGTFVGLVLGGASPAAAARVQLLVLLALIAVELFSALLVGRLLLAAVIAPGERVVVPGRQT